MCPVPGILSYALPRPEFYFLSETNKVRARLACKQTMFYFYFPFFQSPTPYPVALVVRKIRRARVIKYKPREIY